jgi:hypothetical protein
VIGVYERASLLFADAIHSTSPLAEPEAVDQAAARFHRECYAEA